VNHIQQPAAGTNEYALIDSPAQTRNTCAPRLKRSVLLQTREVLVAKNALILETNAKSRARGVHVKSMKDLIVQNSWPSQIKASRWAILM